jgi:serine/threonine protein kinase
MAEDGSLRFSRSAQVHTAYDNYLCYIAHEPSTAVQVFWYEFINDLLTPEQQSFYFKQLCDAQSIQSRFLLRIQSVSFQASPPRFVVITEAMQGPPLSEYLHGMRNPLPLRTCLKWFHSLCDAVRALHEANVVHGAISLRTAFIIQRTGTVKLKMPLRTLSGRPAPVCAIDLTRYSAPETLRGVRARANDIWSLAIILLEMVTNTAAYAECRNAGTLVAALMEQRRPDALRLVQSRLVADFIEACLAPEDVRPTIADVLSHPIQTEAAERVLLSPSVAPTPSLAETLL